METKDSYLKLYEFDDKKLLNNCVNDIYSLLDDYPPIKI